MKPGKNKFKLTIVLAVLCSGLFANKPTDTNHLFKIERSKDADQVVYTINLDGRGKLNLEDPIKVFWVRYSSANEIEPLTWVQKNYAYGITYERIAAGHVEFSLKAYPDRKLLLKETNDGYKVFTISQNKQVELNKLVIWFDGGTFWVPKISKVEIHGKYLFTQTAALEIIKP